MRAPSVIGEGNGWMQRLTWRAAAALGAALCLSGCGSKSPPAAPVQPTAVYLTLSAAKDANATAEGKGAPVGLRVYKLASTTTFNQAEFLQLFERDAALLKDDILGRKEYLLAPGQTKTVTMTLDDKVKAIGVFAAYRDYDAVKWRGQAEFPEHETTNVFVLAGNTGLAVVAAPAKPEKPAGKKS